MSPMHFGNFAGLLSKAVWFALGFAMCYVTLTGLRLWLVRRRGDTGSFEWLDRTVSTVGLGLPFALVVSAAAFLIAMPQGSAVFWTPAAFLIASAGAIVGAIAIPSRDMLDRALQFGTGVTMLLLPLLRMILGGPTWSAAIAAGQPVIVGVDLAFLVAGGWMAWRIARERIGSGAVPVATLMPAE